ncbi:MAG: hypothetical protein OES24_01765 [Acidimicrobiia bacterium]|nr:hypothetical protein [Acidimicrobiia bacterium]
MSLAAVACGDAGTAAIAPPVDGMVLHFGALTERGIDIDADGANVTAAVDGINHFSAICIDQWPKPRAATWWPAPTASRSHWA